MRNLINAVSLTFCILLLGCSTEMAKPDSRRNADAAVVEFLIPVPSLTFVTMDPVQVTKTVDWLKQARATQLPRNKMGAVMPWCKVTLLTFHGTKQISATSVYSSDGATDLLTPKQRQEFLEVFNLEEVETEPYIKERDPQSSHRK